MDDGFSTTIAFSASSSGITLLIYEKEVTPPGVDAGGPTDTTTMLNTTWRTASPKKLKSLAQAGVMAAYDPEVYDEIIATVGVNQSMVITWPDGETLTFWAWIDKFTPNPQVEGEQPTAELIIEPSNQNAAGAETAPQHSD